MRCSWIRHATNVALSLVSILVLQNRSLAQSLTENPPPTLSPELSLPFFGFSCVNPNSPDSLLALDFDSHRNSYRARNAYTSVWMTGLDCIGGAINGAPVFSCTEKNGVRGLRFQGRKQTIFFADIYDRRIQMSDVVEVELSYSYEGANGQRSTLEKKFQFEARHCQVITSQTEVNP